MRLGVIALALAVSVPAAASAAPGDFDPTFGLGGLIAAPPPLDSSFQTYDVAVQTDGRIVAVGTVSEFSASVSAVAHRFNADGSPDSSFGGGDGVVKVSLPSSVSSQFNGVKILPDGSILAAGLRVVTLGPYTSQFLLVKFTATGEFDGAFDGDGSNSCAGNGIVCTQVNPSVGQDTANELDVQANGAIVLGGNSFISAPGTMAAARYTSTGGLDTTFSGDGKLVLPVGSSTNYARNVHVRPDQKIILTGVARALAPNNAEPPVPLNADDIAIAQLNSDGSLDPEFDGDASNLIAPSAGDGKVIVTPRAFQTFGDAYDSALAPDGKIVLAGYANDKTPSPTKASSFAMRFNSDGSLDPSFGSGGRTMIDFVPGFQYGRALALDGIGRPYVVSSYEYATSQYSTSITRLTTSGQIDPSWSGSGTRTLAFGEPPNNSPWTATVQPDGKLLVAVDALGSVAMARFLTADEVPSPPLNPTISITSPNRKTIKASKLRSLAGAAGPTGSVKKVEIALLRKDSKLLKKKRCSWLSSSKAKFKKIKATKGKCSKPYFRTAKGTSSWKYSLSRALPTGSYALTARVTLIDGRSAARTYSFKLKKK